MIVWRDGAFVDAASAVSASDRGFLIGDGVFETVLVERGRPAFFAAHLARLRRGASALGFDIAAGEAALRDAIEGLGVRGGVSGRAACRITATRVGGARGLVASPDARTQIIASLAPIAPARKNLSAVIAGARRLSSAPTNAFKCVGAYAANMLARAEAARAGADEAIMLNEQGRIACASSANLFLIEGEALVTPPESEGATPGVTRALLVEIAGALGVAMRIEPVDAARIAAAPLLFTNSLIGLLPGRLTGSAAETARLAMRLGAAYEARLAAELSEPAP